MNYLAFFIKNLFFILTINSNYFILHKNNYGIIKIFPYQKNKSSSNPFYTEKIIVTASENSSQINFGKIFEENKDRKNNFFFVKTADDSKEIEKNFSDRNKNEILDYFIFFKNNDGEFFVEKNMFGKYKKAIYKFFEKKICFDDGFVSELLSEKNDLFQKPIEINLKNELDSEKSVVIFDKFGIDFIDKTSDVGYFESFTKTCKKNKKFLCLYFAENKNIIGQIKFEFEIENKKIYINTFQINDFFIGYGFGQFTLGKLINFAKDKGIEKISLDSFESSQGFYKKMGFIRSEKNHFNDLISFELFLI